MSNIIIGSYKYLLRKQLEKANANGDAQKAQELQRVLSALEGSPEDRATLSSQIGNEYEDRRAQLKKAQEALELAQPPAPPIPEVGVPKQASNQLMTNQPGMPATMDISSREKLMELLRNIIPENRQGPAVRKLPEDELEIEGKRYRKLPGPYGYEEI